MRNIFLAVSGILLAITVVLSCKKEKSVNNTATLKVSLGSPADGSTVSNTEPVEFSWSGSSTNSSVPVTYKITIVEITGDQTPENAFGTNKPIFEKDTPSYAIRYPINAKSPGLVAGSKYAWKVIAKQAGLVTTGGESAISVFTVKNNETATLKVELGSPADGGSVSGLQPAEFSWAASSSNSSVPITCKITIVQVTGDQTPENAFGTNKPIFEKDTIKALKIQYPPDSKSPGFVAGGKYAWKITAIQEGLITTGGESAIRVFTIPDRLTVTLDSPADGSIISNTAPFEFSWTGSSSNSAVPITYSFRIVEVTGDQTPENAFGTNKPFFEKDTIKALKIQYPQSAGSPGFVAGGKYAWKVTAKQDDVVTEGGESAILVFTVKK